jgi:hypothetical protein
MSEETVRECVQFGRFIVEQWQSKNKKGELKGNPHVRIHSGKTGFALYLRSVEDVREFAGLVKLPEFGRFVVANVKGERVLTKADETAAELKRLREENAKYKAAAEAGAKKANVKRRSGGGKAKAEVATEDENPFA